MCGNFLDTEAEADLLRRWVGLMGLLIRLRQTHVFSVKREKQL